MKNAKYQGSDGFSLVSIILKSTPKLKEDELILTNMFNLVGSTTAKKMLAANFYSDVLFLPTCSVWFGNMIPIDIVSDYFSFFSRHRVREMSDLDFLLSTFRFITIFHNRIWDTPIHHFFGSLGNPSIFSHSKSKFMHFRSGFIWVASIPGDAQHSLGVISSILSETQITKHLKLMILQVTAR